MKMEHTVATLHTQYPMFIKDGAHDNSTVSCPHYVCLSGLLRM